MSGIEVAGLVFGVLPIIALAAKGYRSAHDRIRLCRNYSDELRHYERHIRSRKNVFRNHLQLLLLMALENDLVTQILSEDKMESPNRPWLDHQLNRRVNDVLGDNWNHCKEIIEDVKSILHSLEKIFKRVEKEQGDVGVRAVRLTLMLPIQTAG